MKSSSKEENYSGESMNRPDIKENPSNTHSSSSDAAGMLAPDGEYKELIRNLPVGVFKTAPNGILMDANPAFACLYGYHSVNESISNLKNIHDIFPCGETEILNRILTSECSVHYEHIYKNKKGDYFIAGVRAIAVRNAENKVIFIEGIVEDITNKKGTIDKLKGCVSRIKEENESQQKLFHLIAHDLRNPAAQLIMIHTLIEKSLNNRNYEELISYTDLLGRAVHNITELLNNLLHWSLLKTGNLEALPRNLFVKNIVEPVMRHLAILAMSKKIVFDLTIEDDNLQVRADEDMISTILRNLGGNAIKYSFPGGKAHIAVSRYGFDKVLFKVSDHGVGIKKEDFPKLFCAARPFTTRGANNEKGTGLGLIICKEFVAKNNGTIWVESESGKGSSFYFTLPKA